MSLQEHDIDVLKFGGVMCIILFAICMILVLQPSEQARVKQWEYEKSWLNSASCNELLNYIQVGNTVDPEKSNNYFFVSQAKDIHVWKCEK